MMFTSMPVISSLFTIRSGLKVIDEVLTAWVDCFFKFRDVLKRQ